MSADTVPMGEPITQEQAVRAVLRCIQSGIYGYAEEEPGEGLRKAGLVYRSLSRGEKTLVDIARALWEPRGGVGAHISAIGSLDPTNRRKVVIILAYYYYLGRDVLLEVDYVEWNGLFR